MNLNEMVLSDELKIRSLTKKKLAEILGVSRQTIQRMGEDVSDEVLAAIQNYIPKVGERVKEPSQYTDKEIEVLLSRRGGLDADTYREQETDKEIALSIGISLGEFHAMISAWVKRNPYKPGKPRYKETTDRQVGRVK